MPLRAAFLILSILLLLSCPLAGQSGSERPRVGLALGGGGARGFGHLGVLKVLHELRVPVDVVAGTSMGAVVGGVYAQGLSYPELEAAFRAEDWSSMFTDEPARSSLPMRRKRADRELALDFELGLGTGGIRLPPALLSGARLNNALRARTGRARRISDFDALPRPFRAVATDVADGSQVVLGEGDLASAIRASMAVPGAFPPQEIEGRLLVDGGLASLVPADVVRALDADVVIAVNVSRSLDEVPEASDALSLASRLLSTITVGSSRDELARLGPDDLLLVPELGELSSSDFSIMEEAMAAGEAAAREVAPRLRALSLPPARYRALVAERSAALREPGHISVDRVRIDTSRTGLSPRVIRSFLGLDQRDSLSVSELRDNLVRVLGYGGFQSAEFTFGANESGEFLTIRPEDRDWGPLVVRAGLGLLDRQVGAGGWDLRGRVGWTRLTPLGGEVWGEVEFGTRHGLRIWTHLPLTPSELFFVTADASLGRREVFPSALFPLALEAELTDRQVEVGVGMRLGWWGEAEVGATVGRSDFIVQTTLEDDLREPTEERAWHAAIRTDRMDRVDYPSSGVRADLTYRSSGTWLGGSEPFRVLRMDGAAAVSTGHQTFSADLVLSTGLGSTPPPFRATHLGGLDRLTGAPREAVWGGYAGMARLGWGYRLGAPASARGTAGLRFGASVEAGQAWFEPEAVEVSWTELRFGGSVWVGLDTPLGPVRGAFGVLEGRTPGWIVQVGGPF